MTSLAGYGSAASLSSMEGASGSSPFLHAAYRKVAAARQEEMGFTHFSSKNRSTRDEETPLLSTPDTSSSQGSLRPDDDRETTAEPLSWTLLVTVLVVTLGSSFQFGYGTGVMNNSRSFIMGYFESHDKEYTLLEWGTVVSAYGVGGLIGSVLGPKVIGHFTGRRGTLLVNNVFLFLSSYWIAFAPYWWWQVMGRIAIGIVAGVSTAVVPTYLAEISPLHIRGGIATMHQLAITVGILISQCLSTPSLHLLGSEDLWQWLFFVPAVCGLAQIIVLPFCPESPSYLYMQGDLDGARRAIAKFQSEHVVEEYIGYIEEESKASQSGRSMTVSELFMDLTLRKQLIVGVVVQLMMQFSGIDAVFYYSTMVFRQANVVDPELATTGLGVINVIITIFAVKYMDSAGRKTLLRYSWMGMCTSYVILTMSFIAKPYLTAMDQVSIVSMTGVIIFFAFGPGCIAWFIIAEIFPVSARDSAMTIGIFINWVANWLVAFSFPILLQFTQPFTFLIFVASTGYFLYFTNNFVPETKGLTIAQVTAKFDEIRLNV